MLTKAVVRRRMPLCTVRNKVTLLHKGNHSMRALRPVEHRLLSKNSVHF